jgi:hypothetical protein
MSEELDQALSEGHYAFCLQDVADYMLMRGEAKVMEDILRVYQHHRLTHNKKRATINTDSPF